MKKTILILFLINSFVFAEFLRDDTKEIVLDTRTNLIWQDNNVIASNADTWANAITYCEALSFAGFNDWKLPNINELQSLVDITKYEPALNENFENHFTNLRFWSSSKKTASDVLTVVFNNGEINTLADSNNAYIRCVRAND